MANSLFSDSWYKVANLHVRLRKHASIHRHIYRDQVWYLIQDHSTGQFQKFTPQAYQVIALMQGKTTVDEVWKLACKKLGDELPTQDDIIQIIAQLNKANLIQTDSMPDIEQLVKRQKKQQRNKIIQQFKSPLSIKIPLIDPNSFLDFTSVISKIIFNKFCGVLWLLTIVFAITLAMSHWTVLTENISDRLLGLNNISIMFFVYPIMKLIHEFGHAYAVKKWGGVVHEMGVMLLVLIPIPYVDASASNAFRSKYKRMLVSGIGVMLELFMAALAMIIWILIEPGITRSIAFNIMMIGGVSSILFNGNPLLRFDAYYVLSDFLEIPNLGNKANAYVIYLFKRYLFSLSNVRTDVTSKKEALWLIVYSITSYIYRIIVMIGISLVIATKYFILGTILAIWSFCTTIIFPILKLSIKPMTNPQLYKKRFKIYTKFSVFIFIIVLFLFLFPIPYKTLSEGVLYVAEEDYIKAPINGFVKHVYVKDGDAVEKMHPLIVLESPTIQTKVRILEEELKEANVKYQASIINRIESDILQQERDFIRQQLIQEQQKLNQLQLNSLDKGVFIIPTRKNILGEYFKRGETIALLVNYQKLKLAVLVDEDDIKAVRNDSRNIEIKFVSDLTKKYTGKILHNGVASSTELPSKILTQEGGGVFVQDPKAVQELTSYNAFFKLELDVKNIPMHRFDERVYVLFEHQPEALFWRWYRSIRRLFLRQLDV